MSSHRLVPVSLSWLEKILSSFLWAGVVVTALRYLTQHRKHRYDAETQELIWSTLPKSSCCGITSRRIQRGELLTQDHFNICVGSEQQTFGTALAQTLSVLVSGCLHLCQVKRFRWCQDQQVSKEEVKTERSSFPCPELMIHVKPPTGYQGRKSSDCKVATDSWCCTTRTKQKCEKSAYQ